MGSQNARRDCVGPMSHAWPDIVQADEALLGVTTGHVSWTGENCDWVKGGGGGWEGGGRGGIFINIDTLIAAGVNNKDINK
jgi:hypothetical protein